MDTIALFSQIQDYLSKKVEEHKILEEQKDDMDSEEYQFYLGSLSMLYEIQTMVMILGLKLLSEEH